MTTIALHGTLASEVSFKQAVQSTLTLAWTAFVNARMNRAKMMVSFYSAR